MRNHIYEKYGCNHFFVHFMYCGEQLKKNLIPHVNFGRRLKVITATAIKGVSDGESVYSYTAVNHALPSLI